jgi:flagellar basal body-associated protein FliL
VFLLLLLLLLLLLVLVLVVVVVVVVVVVEEQEQEQEQELFKVLLKTTFFHFCKNMFIVMFLSPSVSSRFS